MLDINLIPPDLRKKPGATAFLAVTLVALLAAILFVAAALALLTNGKNADESATLPPAGVETTSPPPPPPGERKQYVDETVASVRELMKEQRFSDAAAATAHGVATVEAWGTPDAAEYLRTLDNYLATSERLRKQRELRLALNDATPPGDDADGNTEVVRHEGTRFRLPVVMNSSSETAGR